MCFGIEQQVAFHDPCRLTRKLKSGKAPRELISRICGKPAEELFHSGAATEFCGSGTVMRLTDPEIVRGVAGNRIKSFKETKAATLITACQNCKTIFMEADGSEGIAVTNLAELGADNFDQT